MDIYGSSEHWSTSSLRSWLTKDEKVCRHINAFIENEWDKCLDDNFVDKNEFIHGLTPNLKSLVVDEVLDTIGTTSIISGFIRSSMLTILNEVDWRHLTESLVDEAELAFDTDEEQSEQWAGSVQG